MSIALIPSCSSAGFASTQPRAVIVDQLSAIRTNDVFINRVSDNLISYGFDGVDVFQGEELGLSFFIELPAKGYRLIIFRVHSGLLEEEDGENWEGTWLFTNEPCERAIKYTDQRLSRKIAMARIDENYPPVFAIGSKFVTGSMMGDFSNALVIAMGCRSFNDDELARAFIDKGASAYVGWKGLVELDYTDDVTMRLVENLCTADMPLKEAIETAIAESSVETSQNVALRYYPPNSGGQTISELVR